MMGSGGERERSGRWQFSLLAWLLATTLIGTTIGLAGPSLLRTLRGWADRPRQTVPAVPLPPPSTDVDVGESYYESAETPLD